MDTLTTQGPIAMDWLRDNFWVILAVAIFTVSVSLALILYCACRQLFRQGKRWDVAKPLGRGQSDEEKTYENVLNESPVQLPPLPPRGLLFPEHTLPQETPGQPSAIYGQINKGRNQKTVSILSIWRLKIIILKLLCSALLTSLRADGVFLSEMGRL
ncbi:SLP adapter and CSK-interacting membrane protein isoform X1 [Felis catus]|uniref:SLP adapter and CSK-interacting membrane protein isoform X1 n=1 Tax=Felis catus TaxID=9685 RepID=UPI001D19959A|nr:SLP adapter and CSK-interacting membrane protein isoform X1 [Felis catus]